MNVRLDVAVRDIMGKSGLVIIEATLSGSRAPQYLAFLVDIRVKKSKQEIADSLQGWWREELIFELRASLGCYKVYEKSLSECDHVIEIALMKYAPVNPPSPVQEKLLKVNKKRCNKNTPEFNVSKLAWQYFRRISMLFPG